MTSERTLESFLQVRPSGLVAYSVYTYTGARTTNQYSHLSSLGAYSGTMSKGSIKRLKRAVMILAACAEWKEARNFKTGRKFRFKVNFITLTLSATPDGYSHYQIKSKVLDPFLKRCVRKFGLKSYIWRAELQKNGNIHFHIMSDCYIHYKSIQHNWNECQERLGLISKFEETHGHRNPNSTDVHAVKNFRHLGRYIAKYMSKMTQEQIPMKGRCWSASQNLLRAKFLTFEMDSIAQKIWDSADKLFWDQKFDIDFCSFIPLSTVMQKRLLPEQHYNELQEWKRKIIRPDEN